MASRQVGRGGLNQQDLIVIRHRKIVPRMEDFGASFKRARSRSQDDCNCLGMTGARGADETLSIDLSIYLALL